MQATSLRWHDLGEEAIEIDGIVLPRSFTVTIEHNDSAHLRLGVVYRGKWRVTEAALTAVDGSVITDADLARLAPPNLDRTLTSLASLAAEFVRGQAETSEGRRAVVEKISTRQNRRKEVDLEEVARVYRDAARPKLEAVEKAFDRSKAQASRYVARAREEGLIEPSERN